MLPLKYKSYLPEVLWTFLQYHGGELQNSDSDGAFVVVVLLCLTRAEVWLTSITHFEASPGSLNVLHGQLCKEETERWQKAGLLTSAWMRREMGDRQY